MKRTVTLLFYIQYPVSERFSGLACGKLNFFYLEEVIIFILKFKISPNFVNIARTDGARKINFIYTSDRTVPGALWHFLSLDLPSTMYSPDTEGLPIIFC